MSISMSMWSSRADVLKDLNEVNRGSTGVMDLDNYISVGERPPPDRRESLNEDEIQHHFGELGGMDGVPEPDLDGISQMLQLVNEDSMCDNEPTIIIRNPITDTIRISKLNPNVTEFVPGIRRQQPQFKQKKPEKNKLNSPTKLDQNNRETDKVKNKKSNEIKICDVKKEIDQDIMKTPNNMLNEAISNEIKICDVKKEIVQDIMKTPNNMLNEAISNEIKICDVKKEIVQDIMKTPNNMINKAISNEIKICDVKKEIVQDIMKTPINILNEAKTSTCKSNTLSKDTASSNDISLDRKVDVSNMETDEIEEIKLKIKSKIIDTTGDSMENKKRKNVAIAALLRLQAAVPAAPEPERRIKLITPDYFETPPAEAKNTEPEVKDLNSTGELEETPTTSTSSIPVYKDPFVEESIAKVNDWFENADNPKPKPMPVLPPVAAPAVPAPPVPAPVPLAPSKFREALSFKKKNTSTLSVNSRKSETSCEKKKQSGAFVPSSYANDLLQKYENNAKTQVPLKEDWRVSLERNLREKDEIIRKKIREKQEATSPTWSGN